jgi:hypothetical protein
MHLTGDPARFYCFAGWCGLDKMLSSVDRALRKPQPAERDYLAMQMTGSGLAIGRHSRCMSTKSAGCHLSSTAMPLEQKTAGNLQLRPACGLRRSLGGWMVDAPLAEGPAEAAGILRGERILQIGVHKAAL